MFLISEKSEARVLKKVVLKKKKECSLEEPDWQTILRLSPNRHSKLSDTDE